MASILREGDSTSIESPIAWAGLAMVHRAQHEIVAGFEIEHNELVEVKEHAIYSLKQVGLKFLYFYLRLIASFGKFRFR